MDHHQKGLVVFLQVLMVWQQVLVMGGVVLVVCLGGGGDVK